MASNKQQLKIAIFEDGTHAVLRADPAKPRLMEVIATFYEAADARDYLRSQGMPSEPQPNERRPILEQAARRNAKLVSAAKSGQTSRGKPKQSAASSKLASQAKTNRTAQIQPKPASETKPQNAATGMSERQTAVLKALHSFMDRKKRVEVSRAELANASSVPLGSLRSVLASLEKKHMIRTERLGSPKFSAIYEILKAGQKPTRVPRGAVHSKAAHA